MYKNSQSEQLILSFAQEQLWFLAQLDSASIVCNISAAFRISGNLDIHILEKVLSQIVCRHEVLRTSFTTVNGMPIRVIHPQVTININLIDLQQVEITECETILNQQIQQEAITPFDLEVVPLIRFSLLQLPNTENVLLLTTHHLICDGGSIVVLISEISSLYWAFAAGKASPLPELTIQYSDFVIQQRQFLTVEVLDTQIQYWKTQLSSIKPAIDLPTDYPRTSVKTNQIITQSLVLPESLVTSLLVLSEQEGVTLSIILLAIFAILLHRYTGEENISIVSPIVDCNQTESNKLVGFFTNTVVWPIAFSTHTSFSLLLKQIQQIALDVATHQYIPFQKMLAELQLEQGTNINPRLQVWFNMLICEDMQLESPGLPGKLISIQQFTAQCDLNLCVVQQKQTIKLHLAYNADLLSSERIMALLDQYRHLLVQVVSDPQVNIADLSLVTPKTKLILPDPQQSLHPQSAQAVHLGFCQQVQRFPRKIAVVDQQGAWSYIALEERANQLAHYLLAHNIHSQQIVAIYAHRNAALVWIILGVLKAGCAIMILDPAYPTERLINCLEIAQPRACLNVAEMQLPTTIREYLNSSCISCLDFSANSILPIHAPGIVVQPDDLAYVAFTSGSTGKPKGIKGTHRPLYHFLQWHIETFGLNELDRFSMLSGLAHDPLFRDIFTPLSIGATLCIPSQEDISNPHIIADWIQQQRISVAHLTPAMGQILSADTKINTADLRYLFFGGDVLTKQDIINIRHFAPQSICVNFYGATETPQAMGYFIIPHLGDHISHQQIPLGRGIADVQLLVLNINLNLVGISELGEIYVRTPYLAQGYIDSEQLTQEKFIVNPLTDVPEDRLYKTGDLGRYLPDGNVEFLGRKDNQVKLRGFRIDLGEIETILNTHPLIKKSIVVVVENIPRNKGLIGYLLTEDKSLTLNQLRDFLLSKLPEYMIPSTFISLDTIPLTPNGKIDFSALPTPDGEIASSDEYIPPHTLTQEIIADIFTILLGKQNLSINDNFFTLGGHSLLATQLISRLRQTFNIEIPFRTVFEFPTVIQLDKIISQLRANNTLTISHIPARTVDIETSPLSFAQERLWFLAQLDTTSAAYNMSIAIQISGSLDTQVLQQALSEIVRRHEILRTSFLAVNGTPVQVIHPQLTVNINLVDLQLLEITEYQTSLRQQIQREAITPFNLEVAPLVRCTLLQLSATEYVLLLSMHHIVSDGWSVGVLISELSSLYQTFLVGEASRLPELAIQYADFAIWQKQWLTGEVLETQLNYWQSQLQNVPSILNLPTNRPRPKVQTYKGSTQKFIINLDLTKKLRSLASKFDNTLFMTLYAAFATLLYRYSGESDILIGTPIANRNRNEIESLIGFFVNTLVLRTQFAANLSFESLLSQVRETTLQAYAHQDVPFEQVVEALQPQRSSSYSPLFQVMFALQNTPVGELELNGCTWRELATENTIAKFDLTVSMSETEAGLVSLWEYNTDLFDGSTIERMANSFQNLLSAIVKNPQQAVDKLTLLSAAECHQLLVEWNDTKTEYPQDKCIHQLFEEQVEKTPEAIAVTFRTQQLTYQQLNQRANLLAHQLRNLGVRTETLVGICSERSIEMVVGILGILKAGCAYVPLDPRYPVERLSYMLADSAIEVLLTQNSLLGSLPQNQARLFFLDQHWETISTVDAANVEFSQENPAIEVCPANLAYVIYTSGSTGKPKGVAIQHQGLCNLIKAQRDLFAVEPTSRIIQFASVSFDASVWEIFIALTSGAMLVLGTASELMPGDDLQQILKQFSVTHVLLPPSALAVLPSHDLPALSHIIVGGEACFLELAHQWSIGRRFFNAYGPTESTIIATVAEISHGSKKVSIGRPIANTQIYILDKYLQPLPIGVTGELYIGGDGLARGYLNRPNLNQEKFVPNPFSCHPSARLYKTGDLARYLIDGNIEYMGRIDQQVKLRGFRIELGEIEAILNTHQQIQKAVVVVREDIPGNKYLVVYIVTSNKSLTTNILSEFLRNKLPEYMVPNAFVLLDTLPVTPNGKIDFRALPAPERENSRENEYVAPSTVGEEIIANIFSKVLGIESIGVEDDFFRLGGHSLLATQLISRLKQAFNVEIQLRAVFTSPTVSALSKTLAALRSTENKLSLPPIQLIEREKKQIPLSWAQERLWFINQLEGASPTYNISIALRISGDFSSITLQKALLEIVKRHEVLRTSFQAVNGIPMQVIHPEACLNIKMVDLQLLETKERETTLQQLIATEANTNFDLGTCKKIIPQK